MSAYPKRQLQSQSLEQLWHKEETINQRRDNGLLSRYKSENHFNIDGKIQSWILTSHHGQRLTPDSSFIQQMLIEHLLEVKDFSNTGYMPLKKAKVPAIVKMLSVEGKSIMPVDAWSGEGLVKQGSKSTKHKAKKHFIGLIVS